MSYFLMECNCQENTQITSMSKMNSKSYAYGYIAFTIIIHKTTVLLLKTTTTHSKYITVSRHNK